MWVGSGRGPNNTSDDAESRPLLRMDASTGAQESRAYGTLQTVDIDTRQQESKALVGHDENEDDADDADDADAGDGDGVERQRTVGMHRDLSVESEETTGLEASSDSGNVLNAWSRFIFSSRGIGLLLLILAMIVFGILAFVFRDWLFATINSGTTYIKSQGPTGALILIFAIFITSFPPMIGYSWCLFACGYIYGWIGFFPAYIGALLGGIGSFILFRYFFRSWVEKQTRSYPKYVALERAIEHEGLPLVILVRLAPFPYPLFNALFAASRVPFETFVIGTAISLVKLLIHISIGKSLSNFQEALNGNIGSKWDLLYLFFGLSIGIGVSIYLYFRTKQHLQRYTEEVAEDGNQNADLENIELQPNSATASNAP